MSPEIKFQFDDARVKGHFAAIEKLVNEQQGKKGHNPFLWLAEKVNHLADRYRGYTEKVIVKTPSRDIHGRPIELEDIKEIKHPPERTKELQDAILAVPLEIPKLELSVDLNPTDYNIQRDKPVAGLNLPQRS